MHVCTHAPTLSRTNVRAYERTNRGASAGAPRFERLEQSREVRKISDATRRRIEWQRCREGVKLISGEGEIGSARAHRVFPFWVSAPLGAERGFAV